MKLIERARNIAKDVTNTALNNAQLVAQAAADTGRQTLGDVADNITDLVETRKLEKLPESVNYLLENDTARILLADAVASAERAATEDTTWDEILKAALLDLKSTPAGGGA